MEKYMGQIMMFGGNFAPKGWSLCDGRSLSIGEYTGLFSVIGTTYGGDGITSFNVPDLRGRVPMQAGTGHGLSPKLLGQMGGSEEVELQPSQLPSHSHLVTCSDARGQSQTPSGQVPAAGEDKTYDESGTTVMASEAIQATGGNDPHPNLPPYQCVNFIIALVGEIPERP